jgi:thioredoxin-related protein
MKKFIIVLFLAGIAVAGFSQTKKVEPEWQDFSKIINGETGQDKIGVIYVYNTPCDLCTTTEATILADSTVIKALKKDFIAAKFDSATKDDVVVKDKKYPVTENPDGSGINIYAVLLLDGRMGYPTFVFMDKEGTKIGKHFPVKDSAEFLQILKFYSSGDYAKTTYEEWIKKQ